MRALVFAFLFFLAGCDGYDDDRDHEDEHEEAEHVHHAKWGGQLIELGDHYATIEMVHDPAEGKLTAYVMDRHANQAVRLDARSIPVTITVAGEDILLDLEPVAHALTGETVGDTSRFEATADVLKRIQEFQGSIAKVRISDQEFTGVAFTYKPRSAD